MNDKFLKAGYIVKSFEEQKNMLVNQAYFGIGRYKTWPLEDKTDSVSVTLTEEAYKRWFCYRDRLWVVPDLTFIKRYMQHCGELGIEIFCLQIDSVNPVNAVTDVSVELAEMGYDYADADMETSCLNEDITTEDFYIQQQFLPVIKKLNQYGMLNSEKDIEEYLSIRKALAAQGYDMEEYYNPAVVKLSKANIP